MSGLQAALPEMIANRRQPSGRSPNSSAVTSSVCTWPGWRHVSLQTLMSITGFSLSCPTAALVDAAHTALQTVHHVRARGIGGGVHAFASRNRVCLRGAVDFVCLRG